MYTFPLCSILSKLFGPFGKKFQFIWTHRRERVSECLFEIGKDDIWGFQLLRWYIPQIHPNGMAISAFISSAGRIRRKFRRTIRTRWILFARNQETVRSWSELFGLPC